MREVKPTQKPVPSSDIKDLFFNSGLLDIWATSLERKYIDRFGNCHLTAAGMEWIFNELVEEFKVDMNTAIVAAGYITVDSFQQGADLPNNELTQRNHILRDETTGEYFRWDGDLPKQVLAGSTPQSTGGIGKGAWVSVGDASLRSDLKRGDGSLIGLTNGTLKDAINYVTPEMFGAKGDTLLSINADGSYTTNPNATDDTVAIRSAIDTGRRVIFNGDKGYLISDIFDNVKSGQTILGNGAKIVYRGGKSASSGIYRRIGVFQPTGNFNFYDIKAEASATANTLDAYIDVKTSTLKLKVGDYFTLRCDNGVTEAQYETNITRQVLCMPRVTQLLELNEDTTRMFMSYKMGYTFSASQITIGTAKPLINITIKDFTLIDEMVATPTPYAPYYNPVQAPESEREEAIGLLKFICCANVNVSGMKGHKIKWPLCSVMLSHSFSCSSMRVMSAVWSGGGEGYCVGMAWCANWRATDLLMLSGRHIIDTTACSWGAVYDAHAYEDQVGLTSHTTCDHDISYYNCTSKRMGFANGPYGKVTSRLTFVNCNFQRVAMEGAMYVSFYNCFLNEVTLTGGNISFYNSELTDVKWIRYDARTGTDAVVNSFAKAGTLHVDAGTRIIKSGTWYSSNAIQGWSNVYIDGLIESPATDVNPTWNIDNVSNFKCTGELKNIQLVFQGTTQYIQLTGAKIRHTRSDITAGSVLAWGKCNPPGVQYVTIRNNDFQLANGMMPYDIKSNESNTEVLAMCLSIGGNNQISGKKGVINDYNGSKLTFTGFSYTKESCPAALAPEISVTSDAVRYKSGDVALGKGGSGRPAVWNESSSTWITLN